MHRGRPTRSSARGAAAVLAVALMSGCGSAAPKTDARPDASADADAGTDASDDDPSCPALPSDVSGAPMTIADAVTMANALVMAAPGPLTIPCFLSRLDRPLAVTASSSAFSLQPAEGRTNPRMFVFFGPTRLVISVSTTGEGSFRIELAEYRTSLLRSIKAEIVFPMRAPISQAQPFDHIRATNGGTVCNSCHYAELPAPQIAVTQAFESGVFQPRFDEIISVPDLQDLDRACDPQQEPYRCALLRGLFRHGEVTEAEFPAGAPTIYGAHP